MKKTDLSKYDNSWYKPGKKIVCILWYFVNVVFFVSHVIPFSSFKVWLLKLFGAKIGRNVVIKPGVNIKYPWKLVVGDYTWIGEDVWIDNLEQVIIGSNVCISQGAMLLCGNHNYKKNTFDLMVNEIVLEEGVWIGAKSIICSGVRCKTHSILSVGSITNIDLEPYSIYKGNPAKKIRNRVIKS